MVAQAVNGVQRLLDPRWLAYWQPRVHEKAWPYLKIQCGSLYRFASRETDWIEEYRKQLLKRYDTIEPFLPPSCEHSLDVGGGMGGINILLAKAYDGKITSTILDGTDDPPTMKLHAETFSNEGAARVFLATNGQPRTRFVSPKLLGKEPAIIMYDLVVSFGAWCFHTPPEMYLDYVERHTRPGARLIVEMRYDKPEWLRVVTGSFTPVGAIGRGRKYETWAFTRR